MNRLSILNDSNASLFAISSTFLMVAKQAKQSGRVYILQTIIASTIFRYLFQWPPRDLIAGGSVDFF
ncbi:MAG: hypothetical protein ACOYM4_14630, partial [Nodosilinea sp.]